MDPFFAELAAALEAEEAGYIMLAVTPGLFDYIKKSRGNLLKSFR